MFLTTLPFDYAVLADRGDRVRTPARRRPSGVRRPTSSGRGA
jgi:hypothetical protein